MANMSANCNFVGLKIPVQILRENDDFIAYTPAFDISTSGKSYEEAKKRFSELVEIFLEETTEAGTLETALEELGWKCVQKKWMPPVVVAQEMQEIKMPA
ncbi:MAG: hypothetical protein JW727_05530 [Candidatus Aenigmarchaeota archaeon]|nr:hypothetical protein [Candidatus Aenigmarchaeota archaeon]